MELRNDTEGDKMIKLKVVALCFCCFLFSSICFALEGQPICDLGADELYKRCVENGINMGANRKEVTNLNHSVDGECYFFLFPASKPEINNIIFFTNKSGYVTMICIDGNVTTKENVNSIFATTILSLKAIGLNEDEIQYSINSFKENKSKYRPISDTKQLYTSDVYVKMLHRTITIMFSKNTDAHTQTYISVIK